nr:DM13 domain-containing protein [Planobispora longispora]
MGTPRQAPTLEEETVRIKRLLRHPVGWVVLGAGAVAFAVALYLFQPWRLFTTVEVNEAVPVAAGTPSASGAPAREAAAKELAAGTFVSHEHDTSGKARLLELADGSRVLRIEDLDTSDGPDLRVWLSDQPVKEGKEGWFNLDDGKHLELGELKGNRGTPTTPSPPGPTWTN